MILAIAAGQLRIFDCSNNKKIKKFSGHPVSVMQSILLCCKHLLMIIVSNCLCPVYFFRVYKSFSSIQ